MKKIIIPNRNLQTKVNTFETRVLGSAGGVVIDKNRMLKSCVDFEDASILFTPNGFRATRLQNVIPNTAGGDFTFSRASQRGIINSSGVYEMVGNNIPGLDWRTGIPALLNENQSTNLCFPSDVAVTQNISTLLDAVSRPHWLSFVGTGSVTVSGSGTATLNGTGASNRVVMSVLCSTGTATLTPSGDVREIQFERGWTPTSYIPTLSSAMTRLAENAITGSIASQFGQTEGTYYFEFQTTNLLNSTIATKTLGSMQSGDGRQSLAFQIGFLGANQVLYLNHRNQDTPVGFQFLNSLNAPVVNLGFNKVVYKITNQNTGIVLKIFLNGMLVTNVTSTSFLTAGVLINTLRIGGESAFFSGFNDRIFKVAHWNFALTDAKCQRLTTL